MDADITCFDRGHWQSITEEIKLLITLVNKGELLNSPIDKYKDLYEKFIIDEQRKKIEATSNININNLIYQSFN